MKLETMKLATYTSPDFGEVPIIERRSVSRIPALETQVGGSHYKDMSIQPVEYILANNLNFLEGNVIKYVSRWKNKNGVADLLKARHYVDMLIENAEKTN